MKKILHFLFLTFLVGYLTVENRAEKLEIGMKFPVDKLSQEEIQADNTIIAFVPSLTDECEYASMLTQSFYYYFDQQLAFENLPKAPTTKIFLVVGDKINAARSTRNIIGKMKVIYDEPGELFEIFGVARPAWKNADSTVVLLDADHKIALIDKNYRAQGEHLKPLENKLQELNGINLKISLDPRPKELKIGDPAPDFRINKEQKLSDLRGQVVLLSFYPAAFSGVLPKSDQVDLPQNFDTPITACFAQIKALDLKPAAQEKPVRIVISSSTDSILHQWQKILETQNIIYANDADYSTSVKYLSYNPGGYNNRVSIIIDRQGKIAYLDTEFETKDEEILRRKLDQLLKKK